MNHVEIKKCRSMSSDQRESYEVVICGTSLKKVETYDMGGWFLYEIIISSSNSVSPLQSARSRTVTEMFIELTNTTSMKVHET